MSKEHTQRRKPGRPKSANPLCERVTVRLTRDEMRALSEMADGDVHAETVSGYLRVLVIGALASEEDRDG